MTHWTFLKNEREFRNFLLAVTVSGIGDWFNSVAVLSLLYTLTGSGMAVGITLAIRTLPYLALGPVAGSLADRVPRKQILLWGNGFSTMAALGFLVASTTHQVWIVYVSSFGLVVAAAVMGPARSSVPAQLVASEQLGAANALTQTAEGTVMAIGSLLGGLAISAFGVNVAFVLNALSFLICTWLLSQVELHSDVRATQRNNLDQRVTNSEDRPRHMQAKWTEVVQIFRGSRVLQAAAWMGLIWPIGGGIVNVLLTVYAYQVFHAGKIGVGVMYGALGLGFIFGGIIARHLSRWQRPVIVIGFMVEGLAHALASQAPTLFWNALCLVAGTAGAGVADACLVTLIMQSSPGSHHGRVFGVLGSVQGFAMSVCMLVTGAAVSYLPPRSLGLLAGTLLCSGALVAGAVILRREEPVSACENQFDAYEGEMH